MQESQSHLNSAAQSLLKDWEILSAYCVTSPRMRASSLSPTPQQLISPTDSTTVPPAVATSHASSMERRALGFFRALLVWNDILSCSSRKTRPLDVERYRTLLAEGDFSRELRDTIGCESWILVSILDATSLEIWKRHQDAQENLSIRELVSRAEKIESFVEQGIKKLSIVLEGLTPCANTDSCQNSHGHRRHHVQTYIFAHSVLAHLHSIVSGSYPGVPEIQQSVNRAISAWELCPSVINLNTLAWAYCVGASLAVGSQRDVFRSLISEPSPRAPTLGSILDIKSIVEECWRGFDGRKSERDVSCDWKDVMQRLNLSVVFA